MGIMGSSIAIITARGGSKRIPRKNIKEFCGKPIISYSIEAALQSGLFEEVMVSTDDEEIAAVARAAGAQVPFMRSSASAGDYASTDDVLLGAVAELWLQHSLQCHCLSAQLRPLLGDRQYIRKFYT